MGVITGTGASAHTLGAAQGVGRAGGIPANTGLFLQNQTCAHDLAIALLGTSPQEPKARLQGLVWLFPALVCLNAEELGCPSLPEGAASRHEQDGRGLEPPHEVRGRKDRTGQATLAEELCTQPGGAGTHRGWGNPARVRENRACLLTPTPPTGSTSRATLLRSGRIRCLSGSAGASRVDQGAGGGQEWGKVGIWEACLEQGRDSPLLPGTRVLVRITNH